MENSFDQFLLEMRTVRRDGQKNRGLIKIASGMAGQPSVIRQDGMGKNSGSVSKTASVVHTDCSS